MNCVILQPSYVPWRGYFHQIWKADVFVFFDDVQYDARGWRSRNRIRGPNGSFWLTIPVRSKHCRSEALKVNEVEIDWSRRWNEKHLKSLAASYGNAPFFERYRDMLTDYYTRRDRLVADLAIDFTMAIAAELGIKNTECVRSSTLLAQGQGSERILSIMRAVGASHYITGPSARSYLDEDLFCEAGIGVEYMRYEYPAYEQAFEGFDPHVSILDLLFMKGGEAPRYIWQRDV